MDVWAMVLTGGVAAAMVKIIDNIIQWRLARKAKNQDADQVSLEGLARDVQALREANTAILHDRIKYLSRAYARAGSVELDDLNDLQEMHRVYHSLGGENLVRPMEDVEKLPIKYD